MVFNGIGCHCVLSCGILMVLNVFLLHGITLYCIQFLSLQSIVQWYCMALHGIEWYCRALCAIERYCMLLSGSALYRMVLHCITWYWIVLHGSLYVIEWY